MRILQLLQKPQWRGAEIFASQLATYLQQQGHEVLVVYLCSGEEYPPFDGKILSLNARLQHRFWDLKSWYRLARMISEFKPDIVQANAGDTLKYAGLSRFFFRWKAKLVFRNANLISGFMDSWSKRQFNRFLLSQCDGVASVSQLCLKDFLQVFPFWNKPISYLPIGVEQREEGPLPEDIRILVGEQPFLIHVGSFVPEKNHAGLVRIFEDLRVDYPHLRLIGVGRGPLFSQVEQSGTPGISWVGSRRDVHHLLPHACALLLPSLLEGLPGVILEAMQAKVPVVCYDVGGISEVVLDQKTGFLLPLGDEKGFSQVIKTEILNPNPRLRSVIEEAKAMVEDRYLLDRVAEHFLRFFEQLLNSEKG